MDVFFSKLKKNVRSLKIFGGSFVILEFFLYIYVLILTIQNKKNKLVQPLIIIIEKMTKTEEALCNGVIFSIPRMIPTAVQEGELENALYYVIVYLTPKLDKMVLKFYEAPSYKPIKWYGNDIECITIDMVKLPCSVSENNLVGYNYGTSGGGGFVYPGGSYIGVNKEKMYNGLMLYPGLKCILIRTINEILNHQ